MEVTDPNFSFLGTKIRKKVDNLQLFGVFFQKKYYSFIILPKSSREISFLVCSTTFL